MATGLWKRRTAEPPYKDTALKTFRAVKWTKISTLIPYGKSAAADAAVYGLLISWPRSLPFARAITIYHEVFPAAKQKE